MKLNLVLSFFSKREKNQLLCILLAMLIMGFIELLGVGSIGPFISMVSNPEIIHSNVYLDKAYTIFNFSSDTDFITMSGIAVIVVLAISNICLSAVNFLIYFFSAKRKHSFEMQIFERYLRQPYIFYLKVNTANLTKIILNDVGTFVNNIIIPLLNTISSSIIALSIIILLVLVNPSLALILSLALGFSYIILFSLVRKYVTRKGKERDKYNYLKFKYINETFGGIKDIKILGKERVFLNLFSGPSRKFAMNDAKSDVVNDLPKYLLETLVLGGIIVAVIVMIKSGGEIYQFLPVLTIYAFGSYRLLPLLQKIFRAVASIRYYFPIIETLHTNFIKLMLWNELSEDVPRMEFSREIMLKDIAFSYPNTTKDVINDQSIAIESNTSIAIVGSTGCGKTTLVDIIMGLLEPHGGKIFIDNIEITNANMKNWQMNIGYVPQTIYLTDDTVRSNIAFGIAPEKVNEEAVIRSAKLANIHEFISSELPEAYNTVVGERGIRLSGGQRQRIGIARAIYHDPSVLILDEATSALDGLTENAIMDAIKNLSHKKTIIMIAHRITTVKNCDVIYMMERGVITDHGNYRDLYARNPTFRKMADGGNMAPHE
jgi:ABC-type multidrug transport system fused ATPase/permease subunit